MKCKPAIVCNRYLLACKHRITFLIDVECIFVISTFQNITNHFMEVGTMYLKYLPVLVPFFLLNQELKTSNSLPIMLEKPWYRVILLI